MKLQALWFVLLVPVMSVHAEGKPIPVPHDPGAHHALIEKTGQASQRLVVTRRESVLGVIYSKRVYNCERGTVALLGTGNTLELMEGAKPLSGMAPVVRDSTAEYIAAEACS